MTKSLGQVAMETFASLIRTDGSYPGWSAHTPDSKAAWQAAAEAVAMEEAKRLRNSGMAGDATKAERKVIEAAKACVQQREERPLDPEHVRQALYFDLAETVAALQEVEGA